MRRASRTPGGERPAKAPDPRTQSGVRGGSVSEVEAACRRIADYLLEISQDRDLEPALHEFLRTFDLGRRRLDPESRARTERVYELIFRHQIGAREGGSVRESCDPHYWG